MGKFYKVEAQQLIDYCTDIFVGYGVTRENAQVVASSLVEADLRHVTSHGVIRLSVYVKRLRSGGTKGNPQVTVVRETPISALIDGDNGLGSIVSKKAMEIAIEKIEHSGIAVVGVRNSAHYGTAAYWALKMAERDMVGISCSNVEPYMAAAGGKGHDIGNNPISFAFPTKSYGPVCYDVACSKMAGGKIMAYALLGKDLPEGCFLDKNGTPTNSTDIAEIPRPFAEHKGYGLAVSVEMLTSILTGSAFGTDIGSQYNLIDQPNVISHLFLGFKIDLFRDPKEYRAAADQFIEYLKALPRADGADHIYFPGELERDSKKDMLANGIVLPADLVCELVEYAHEAGVPEEKSAAMKAAPIHK